LTAIAWLEQRAPGFSALAGSERDLIMHFSLLWSLFESEVLNTNASVSAIEHAVHEWNQAGLLTSQTFAVEAAYFKDRYYVEGAYTDRFAHLYLERSGNPQVVRHVLSGENSSPEGLAAAVLIIVFRYRNNLFHGEKWAYELQGQEQNFTHANKALMRAIELNRQVK
jgi:hypothetical protein